ncbi:MAG: large subunit ribosomal protein L18e [Candidatus Woesearchaeota archaeon]|jgi:large subunit ribosomal protein L18e
MLEQKHPRLKAFIIELEQAAKKSKAPIWKRMADELSKSTRARRTVNMTKLQSVTKDGDSIIVPGKVLATGVLTKKLTVVTYEISEAAKVKITAAGGKVVLLAEEVQKNPKGSKLRIIG